ncbi:MAG: hypothetical protein DA330_02760 [Nitrososphaera sp.]|nr:hypothetical protein [Nitrososphaera sp.]
MTDISVPDLPAPAHVEETKNVMTTVPPTTDKVVKKPMSLKKQVQFVKKKFESGEGYLVTIEAKRVNQAQAVLHGKVYRMKRGKDELAYEGVLTYSIKDPNFKYQDFVLAANIGEESLTAKLESALKGNASDVVGSIVQVITSIGIRFA